MYMYIMQSVYASPMASLMAACLAASELKMTCTRTSTIRPGYRWQLTEKLCIQSEDGLQVQFMPFGPVKRFRMCSGNVGWSEPFQCLVDGCLLGRLRAEDDLQAQLGHVTHRRTRDSAVVWPGPIL
jgi:hypothetical protein